MEDVAYGRKKMLKRFPTPAEAAFKETLRGLKIPFGFQKVVFTSYRYFILDFVIPMKPRLIVEIDGGVHSVQQAHDSMRTGLILQTKRYREYRLMRLSNEQVFNGDAYRIMKQCYRSKD